ncbi:hypothetical protein K443DRAFT_684538 [Laccaria amethystina LaAM-08-1]|uniref:Pheromone receptor n=1 Tax=Laccaria amethystina LaAM-08-1 TaxID=1095629 RepID=A0A0C9X799_9AGAR|nr:hypothetical protein K443DRAFT_684538 [Laccaria amethystina LaAM-08-1]
MDPSYPLYPIFAFLSFIIVLVPLPWHIQAWNSGTCLFMIWTAVACLNQFINSIIWHNNFVDRAPIWCDISTRITVGVAVAIPAASLCINRRLYKIATCQTVTLTHAHKRRAVIIDLLIGLGIPALQMALQFIVQGHRYDLFEDVGCYPTTVNTPAAYPLSFLWPNLIGLVSAVYCVLTLRAFMIRRAQFSQFLSSNTSLTVNRYFRLMALATVELLFNTPISTYGLYLNITTRPIYPWKSWSDIHFDWYTIDVFPSFLWRSTPSTVALLELGRWSLVLCAFVFFGFFGFADEARKNYRKLYWAVAKRFGITPPPATQPKSSALKGFALPLQKTTSTLPVFVSSRPSSPGTPVKHDPYRTSTQGSVHSSDYTETLYASPLTADVKHDFDKSPDTPSTTRSSQFTV